MPLKIKIVCVGKMKEKYFLEAQAEYIKRLSRYANVEVTELADEPDTAPDKVVLQKEGERIKKAIIPSSHICAMAIEGKQRTSEEFAQYIGALENEGKPITFIIGGSLGIEDSIKNSADTKMSMSKMTMPHRLARIVLLEQIFRAFKILRKESYHK